MEVLNVSSPWIDGMNESIKCKFSVDGWNEAAPGLGRES